MCPCKPQFYYINVGFKGESKLYRYVFVMNVGFSIKKCTKHSNHEHKLILPNRITPPAKIWFLTGESIFFCSFCRSTWKSAVGTCRHLLVRARRLLPRRNESLPPAYYNVIITYATEAAIPKPLPHKIDYCFIHYCAPSGNCTLSLTKKIRMLTVHIATCVKIT